MRTAHGHRVPPGLLDRDSVAQSHGVVRPASGRLATIEVRVLIKGADDRRATRFVLKIGGSQSGMMRRRAN